jgi:hypothetical protein
VIFNPIIPLNSFSGSSIILSVNRIVFTTKTKEIRMYLTIKNSIMILFTLWFLIGLVSCTQVKHTVKEVKEVFTGGDEKAGDTGKEIKSSKEVKATDSGAKAKGSSSTPAKTPAKETTTTPAGKKATQEPASQTSPGVFGPK